MVLIVNGIKEGVKWKNFICFPDDYETAFDLLSNFVATGLTLLEASLSDGTSLQKLPVNGFDGQVFSPHLKNLQQEWEGILNKKPQRIENQAIRKFREWDQELILYYEKQMERVCKNLVCNKKAIRKASQKQHSVISLDQIKHYKLMHQKYLQLLNQFQQSHEKVVVHLTQLTEE
jgi:hypothetical protein